MEGKRGEDKLNKTEEEWQKKNQMPMNWKKRI